MSQINNIPVIETPSNVVIPPVVSAVPSVEYTVPSMVSNIITTVPPYIKYILFSLVFALFITWIFIFVFVNNKIDNVELTPGPVGPMPNITDVVNALSYSDIASKLTTSQLSSIGDILKSKYTPAELAAGLTTTQLAAAIKQSGLTLTDAQLGTLGTSILTQTTADIISSGLSKTNIADKFTADQFKQIATDIAPKITTALITGSITTEQIATALSTAVLSPALEKDTTITKIADKLMSYGTFYTTINSKLDYATINKNLDPKQLAEKLSASQLKTISDNLGALKITKSVYNDSTDFYLGANVRNILNTDGTVKKGTGDSRALVKMENGVLYLNYENDFYGGIMLGKNASMGVDGRLIIDSMNIHGLLDISKEGKIVTYGGIKLINSGINVNEQASIDSTGHIYANTLNVGNAFKMNNRGYGPFKLEMEGNKCIDGGGSMSGTYKGVYDCLKNDHPDYIKQKWYYNPISGSLYNVGANQCVDGSGGSWTMVNCDPNWPGQTIKQRGLALQGPDGKCFDNNSTSRKAACNDSSAQNITLWRQI